MYETEQAARSGAEAVQQRTAEILEGITDAFLAVDRQWRLVYVNKEAGRRLGKGKEDLIGKNLWDEFPEFVGSFFDHELHREVSEQIEVAFEADCPGTSDGIEVHVYPANRGLSVYFHNAVEREDA